MTDRQMWILTPHSKATILRKFPGKTQHSHALEVGLMNSLDSQLFGLQYLPQMESK